MKKLFSRLFFLLISISILSLFISISPTFAAERHEAANLLLGKNGVKWNDAKHHIGEYQTVCGPIKNTNYVSQSSGKPTFLDMGNSYPNSNRVTIIVWGKNRYKFSEPEKYYLNKNICVWGKLFLYKGIPNIEISSPSSISSYDGSTHSTSDVKASYLLSNKEKADDIKMLLTLTAFERKEAKILKKYLSDISVIVYGKTVLFYVDAWIMNEDELTLASDLFAHTAMASAGYAGGDWGINGIAVFVPGPQDTSITYILEGSETIKNIGNGDFDLIWSRMESIIDWGDN